MNGGGDELSPQERRIYPNGLIYLPAYLDEAGQRRLLAEVEDALSKAPLFRPVMPRSGRPFSVRMSNCGQLGWLSDIGGYRYAATHPVTGRPWPDIPQTAQRAWRDLAAYPAPPEACLINLYEASARMGLHQDRDEEALDAPVLSLSLGSSAIFRFGGTRRGGPIESLTLNSGDAVLLAGAARLVYHGVARILPGTSSLLPDDCRINLTLRRVTCPSSSGARTAQE